MSNHILISKLILLKQQGYCLTVVSTIKKYNQMLICTVKLVSLVPHFSNNTNLKRRKKSSIDFCGSLVNTPVSHFKYSLITYLGVEFLRFWKPTSIL